MKKIISILAIIAMVVVSLAGALNTPLDLLRYNNGTHGTIELSGVSPESSKAIDETNKGLSAWTPIEMADFGHFLSDRIRVIKQGDEPAGVPDVLINFTKTDGQITPSIDTNPENDVDQPTVDTAEGGLVFY